MTITHLQPGDVLVIPGVTKMAQMKAITTSIKQHLPGVICLFPPEDTKILRPPADKERGHSCPQPATPDSLSEAMMNHGKAQMDKAGREASIKLQLDHINPDTRDGSISSGGRMGLGAIERTLQDWHEPQTLPEYMERQQEETASKPADLTPDELEKQIADLASHYGIEPHDMAGHVATIEGLYRPPTRRHLLETLRRNLAVSPIARSGTSATEASIDRALECLTDSPTAASTRFSTEDAARIRGKLGTLVIRLQERVTF